VQAVLYRAFEERDAAGVNAVALAAFKQYADDFNDWSTRQTGFTKAAELAQIGEMIVAEQAGQIVGAVTYIAPDPTLRLPRADYFDASWAVMRMLVVDPDARGQGVGHALARACITCAQRDGAQTLALHTSLVMTVAQPMYLRMGFKLAKALPPMGGMAYGLYTPEVGSVA
jgi:GNAT superfamily N-acetyltransferase